MEGGPLFLLIVSFWRPSREKGSGVGGEKTGDKRGRGRVKNWGQKTGKGKKASQRAREESLPSVGPLLLSRSEGGRERGTEGTPCLPQPKRKGDRKGTKQQEGFPSLSRNFVFVTVSPSFPPPVHPSPRF